MQQGSKCTTYTLLTIIPWLSLSCIVRIVFGAIDECRKLNHETTKLSADNHFKNSKPSWVLISGNKNFKIGCPVNKTMTILFCKTFQKCKLC